MSWLLLATLGADWWGPVRAIEQGDPVEEGHLAQLLDILANLYLNLYLYLGGLSVWATCLLMFPVTTYGTGPPLLLWCYVTVGTFARRGLSSTAKTLRSLSGVRGSEY